MTINKKYYSTILLLLFATNIIAQSNIVTFIKAVPNKEHYNTKDSVISYPIFQFRDTILSDSINLTVKAGFMEMHDQRKMVSIEETLKQLADDGLSELSYEELLNDARFFSFALFQEWMAAYPTYTTSYYAFDKATRSRITIDHLILPEKSTAFKSYVTGLWKDSLLKYRQDLKRQLDRNDIDSADYSTALGYTESDCLESYSIKAFKLTKDTLEIFFDCGFPRIMLPLDPSGGIIVPFKTITEYLRPKYR
jgi:hypothetical protein